MKKAQATLFIIIAILLVGGIIAYFVTRNRINIEQIPAELSPVFNYYQECIKEKTRLGVDLAGLQGGRIRVPDYVPGGDWAPFSSQLTFMGAPVPYWYYLSDNGFLKEQIPTKSQMEEDIAEYIKENLADCSFEPFYAQGFAIAREEPDVQVTVEDTKTIVKVLSSLTVSKAGKTATKTSYEIELDTKLGKFYDLALEIYNKEKQDVFLEKYAVDTLYSYAPVTGVEIQCAPKVWSTTNIINELKEGLDQNFRTIKFEGSYYELSKKEREYFVVDKPVDESVNVIYSKDWPTKIEIYGEGVDDEIIITEPVGTQEGLGAMGFCYIPYHFVYDVSFPTLIQIYNTEDLFQFPVVVIVDKNLPRNAQATVISQEIHVAYNIGGAGIDLAVKGEPTWAQRELWKAENFTYWAAGLEEEKARYTIQSPDFIGTRNSTLFDFCKFKTQDIEINLYDVNLNPADGSISYECFNQRCRLGKTDSGRYIGKAPACVNGYLHIQAEGFSEKKELFSSNSQSFADIILEKEHELNVKVELSGQETSETTMISFEREDGKATTIAYPAADKIKLSEGNYEVKVYIYGNSSVNVPATSKIECVEVPRAGLLGMFGSTKEQCFEIKTPATKVDYGLVGGGTSNEYLLESQLEKGNMLIKVERLPTPTSLDQLQRNFEIFETRRVAVEFNEGN